MILNHDGQSYEITNWDEFKDTLLTAMGLQIEDEIVKQINSLRLVDTGKFKGSIKSVVQNGELIITSNAPYAAKLEYGTMAYAKQFSDSYPTPPHTKKKFLSKKARDSLPKGMQPFAPFRRVLRNQNIMSRVINKAVKLASK